MSKSRKGRSLKREDSRQAAARENEVSPGECCCVVKELWSVEIHCRRNESSTAISRESDI